MRNQVISPYFDEDAYQGKDVVHEGIRIPLKGHTPDELLSKFDKNAQRLIKLHPDEDTDINYREMNADDLPTLRTMWFDPADPAFPLSMDGHCGIVAIYNSH